MIGASMSPMEKGAMPKPGERARVAFAGLVPRAPGVTTRPMFGNSAAFVNGNMAAGLFGEGLFVRLPEDRQAALLAAGGAPFEPMAGGALRGYIKLAGDWAGELQLAPSSIAA